MPRGQAKHKFQPIRADKCARLYQEVGCGPLYQVSLRKPKTKEEIEENNRLKKEREEAEAAKKSGKGIRAANQESMNKFILDSLKELGEIT